MNRIHFSSATDLWATPQWLFDLLDAEFDFNIDVCALPENAKCRRFLSPQDDGLLRPWKGTCWMNPPYGRTVERWVQKAHQSALEGATVVCLLPARTDTHWWHRHVVHAAEVRFLRGRLRFGRAEHSAPFPSMIVVFRPGKHEKAEVSFIDLAAIQKSLFGC
jgi:phage N-6-adenine-methyltransferase